jgi:hypothetical protein
VSTAKNSKPTNKAFLKGTRIFALELDKKTTVEKITRGFDNIESNDDLTLKISSKSLSKLPPTSYFKLSLEIVSEVVRNLKSPKF